MVGARWIVTMSLAMVSGGSFQKSVGEDIAGQVPQAEEEFSLPFSQMFAEKSIQPVVAPSDGIITDPLTTTLEEEIRFETIWWTTTTETVTDAVTTTTETATTLTTTTMTTTTMTTTTTTTVPTTRTTTTTYDKFLNEEQAAATARAVRANAENSAVIGLAAKVWMRCDKALESATRVTNKTVNKSFGVYSIPAAVRFIADVGQATRLSMRQLMGWPPGDVQAKLLEVGVARPPINQVEHDIIRAASHGKTVALRKGMKQREAHFRGLSQAMWQLRALSTQNGVSMEELLGYDPVRTSGVVVPKVPAEYECPPTPYGLTTDRVDRVDREARPPDCPEGHGSGTDEIELDDSSPLKPSTTQESNSIAGKQIADFVVLDGGVDEKFSSTNNMAKGEELGEKGASIGGSKTADIIDLDEPAPLSEDLIVLDDPKPVAEASENAIADKLSNTEANGRRDSTHDKPVPEAFVALEDPKPVAEASEHTIADKVSNSEANGRRDSTHDKRDTGADILSIPDESWKLRRHSRTMLPLKA